MDKDTVYTKINVLGYEVRMVRNDVPAPKCGARVWFCSYAILPDSHVLKNQVLHYPTFRDGDEIGFDSNHDWLNDKDDVANFVFALERMQEAIKSYKKMVKENDND